MAKEYRQLEYQYGDAIREDDVFFYRHVFQDHVTSQGVKESSLQPNLSVDINTLTDPRKSRIIWGMQKSGNPQLPLEQRPYKDPSRFKLYYVKMEDLQSLEELFEKVIYTPLNMDCGLSIGKPKNRAHCEIIYDYETVKIRQKLAGMLKECTNCPDVSRELRTLRHCLETRIANQKPE